MNKYYYIARHAKAAKYHSDMVLQKKTLEEKKDHAVKFTYHDLLIQQQYDKKLQKYTDRQIFRLSELIIKNLK